MKDMRSCRRRKDWQLSPIPPRAFSTERRPSSNYSREKERTPTLQIATIKDWPAMRYRGISDDLSRGPFPTLEFQKRQIRTLAAYKLNVYSPYFENTLQYPSNPVPGLDGGSMTPAEARELVAYAQRYHVVVVPEQEAFGHLHHVLKYEQYAPLAETPMGNVLAPGQPGSLDLIDQWFK